MKAHKRNLYISNKLIIAVAFVAILIFAVFFFIQITAPMIDEQKKLPFSSSALYEYTDTGFIYIDEGRVKYYDLDDDEFNYSGVLPQSGMTPIGYGRNTHAVYDSSTLCIIGQSSAITIDGNIKKAKCGNGFIACLTDSSGIEIFNIYNNKGNHVQSIEIKPDETVIDFGFTDVNKSLMYSVTVNTKTSAAVSTVTTYDFNSKHVTGKIVVSDQLIEDITFTGDSIFINGTRNLMRYGTETSKGEVYRLNTHGYHVTSKAIATNPIFIFKNNDAQKTYIKMYRVSQDNVADEKVTTLPCESAGVFAYSGGAYIISGNTVSRYDTSGNLIEKSKLKVAAAESYKLSNSRLLISGTDGNLYIVKVNLPNAIKRIFS